MFVDISNFADDVLSSHGIEAGVDVSGGFGRAATDTPLEQMDKKFTPSPALQQMFRPSL